MGKFRRASDGVAYIISGWNLKFMVDITMVYGRYSELVFMGFCYGL